MKQVCMADTVQLATQLCMYEQMIQIDFKLQANARDRNFYFNQEVPRLHFLKLCLINFFYYQHRLNW